MQIKPSKNSIPLNFFLVKMGSITAVNNPAEDKHTKAIDTLAYLILPEKQTQCKAIIKPTPNSCSVRFIGNFCDSPLKNPKTNNVSIVIKILYHTSNGAFRVINLPKTPVKPHKKTAI